jgi:glycosyltransferase involved in cell wall biosynthesis
MRLVSIVIPTLKEEEIATTLGELSRALVAIPVADAVAFEVILADDSAPPFKEILDRAVASNDARFGPRVRAQRVDGPHLGKGAAIRAGVLASRGDVVFTVDADLPVPLEHFGEFLRIVDEGYDVVVAERPFDRNASQPVRFVASRALFVLQRALVFQSAAFLDTQCGFKAYRGDLLRRFAERQIVDGGMVDIEYLYAAVRARARIRRVAVVPNPETRASKINVRRAIVQDPIDLVRIKWHGLTGGYRVP